MKILKYVFFLIVTQYSFAQSSYRNEDIISGEVTVNNKPETNFKVFLFKSKRKPENSILKYDSKGQSSHFNIVLSPIELRFYKFLEITTLNGYKTFKISSLSRKKKLKQDSEDQLKIDIEYIKIRPDTTNFKMIEKPAIYLYPEKETEIIVKHEFSGKILTTYPAYNNGWEVIAQPNGMLLNKVDQRNYSYLFWDGSYHFPKSHYAYKEGFYVEKNDYTRFLQEKLESIGLNITEINDFVVYWLPKLNQYERVFIHFRINDNIDHTSILDISPMPDTMIRVFMEFGRVNENFQTLPSQVLPKFRREKFVVVEWGGSEINSDLLK